MKVTKKQKKEFIDDISYCFDISGVYKIIKDCSAAHMNTHLSLDSIVWSKINKAITNAIVEFNSNELRATKDIVKEATKIAAKDIRLPKCVRNGNVKIKT